MPKQPTQKPLEIPFFGTGYYSYRSQLFSPFRSIGINVIQYHDSVLEGADFELTDLMEWQQRPGYSKYCTEQLSAGEVINQFYSARALNGTLLSMFDSNQRLATFTTTGITTLYNKNTTNQGFVNQVGDTTYFYDGVDAVRYDQIYGLGQNGIASPTATLAMTDTGGWLPATQYNVGDYLLDYNGNIEYVAPTQAAGVNLNITASSVTVTTTGVPGVVPNSYTFSPTTTPNFNVTNFGFNIPATAVILGIQVSLDASAVPPPTAIIAEIQLYNGAPLGTGKFPYTAPTTTPSVYTFGNSSDVWGAALTPSIVNGSSFGFALTPYVNAGSITFLPNYSITVFYFLPMGDRGSAGYSGVSGKTLPIWSASPGTYTPDGLALRWTNLGSVGQWLPGVAYSSPSVILDSNNNLQRLQTVTVTPEYDPTVAYAIGDTVYYAGEYWIAQKAVTGVTPNSNIASTLTSGSTIVYTYNWVQCPNPNTSGSTEPVWVDTIGYTTTDGNVRWFCIGPGSILVNSGYSWGVCHRTMDGHLSTMSDPTLTTGPILCGSTLTPSLISSFSISSNVLTVYAGQSYNLGEKVLITGMTVGTYLNNAVYTVTGVVPSASVNVTEVAITSNVVTATAINYLTAGTEITLNGFTTATFLNGLTVTVLSTGLSGTQFEFSLTHANYPIASDTGFGVAISNFTAAFTHSDVPQTSDTGSVSPIIAQISSTGVTDARMNYSTSITSVAVKGNTVTLTCDNQFFPGNTILVSGLSTAKFLNGNSLQINTATPTEVTAYFETTDYTATADTGTATFCAIEIYRTADGGGIWYYDTALVNPGAGNPWTFFDTNMDSLLNNQYVAPVSHLNDPPPGQLGSIATPSVGGTIAAYWQGRQWLVQGQYLYFDAGADCLNGDPHQSWPPANRFEYPGTILAIKPLQHGLVVLGADYMGLALGGPQTLTFYPDVLMHNFGVSSPNCVYQDAQTLYILTTQGQMYSMDGLNKTNEGHYVSDFIAANFAPANSYVTFHRNGNDVGLFLSNGTDIVLRHGANIGAWSVPAYPVGGLQALNSIETSVGFYSLCAAPATAAGYIMTRTLNTWTDLGGSYNSTYAPNSCGITIGSITLSGPGEELPAVQHIVGYFDAVGESGNVDVPELSILPNEISANAGLGWVLFPPDQVVPEPPPPAALVSQTLQQLRYPVNMMNSQASQYMHHLQIKIIYPSTNAPHTVKALAIKFDQG